MWKNIVFVFVLILSVLSCKDDSLNFQQELDNAINSAADPSAMAEALLLCSYHALPAIICLL